MASELVLLTGATGFIGFRVLVLCLRRGYRVELSYGLLARKCES
jgi:nucleoside-diphosphate-sugar epimerase